jgi:dipeptidyl aminopeptidase/acylaminoacyl peptidase
MAVVSRSTRASAAAPTSFIVGADGTPVTPLTTERSDEIVPSWSRDGRFVYFTSDRAGREQIWQIPSDNGTAELVLDTPALGVVESPDGRALYYWRDGAVWTRPLQGGAEVRVAAHPRWESWVVRDEGLYLLNEWPLPTTDFVDLATGRRTVVRELADWPRARFPASFDLSHDGQWFLFDAPHHTVNTCRPTRQPPIVPPTVRRPRTQNNNPSALTASAHSRMT